MDKVEQRIGDNKYMCYIAGKGPELVLLHGFTGTSHTWQPFVKRWSSVFKVIMIDLPGHGGTVTAKFPSMMTFCDELGELLQSLQITKCHLLGYSMGGRIALSFTKRHPNMVESLILESASPGLRTEKEREIRRMRDKELADQLNQDGIEAFVNKWEELPLFASQRLLPSETKKKIRRERLSQSASGLANSLLNMGTGTQASWWDQLSSLTVPTLLIVGESDQKFIRLNQLMEAEIHSSELVIVQDAGHAVHVEQAEKFATIVLEFLYLKNT